MAVKSASRAHNPAQRLGSEQQSATGPQTRNSDRGVGGWRKRVSKCCGCKMAMTYEGNLGWFDGRVQQFGGCAWKENGGVARICI